ncbi:MAG: NifX-associated nitrogen fixation protein [Polyangiales bacterium]
MSTDSAAAALVVPSHPFLHALIRIVRAEDSHGVWEKYSDAEVLKDFIVTKAQRKALPIIGDPDPEILDRVEHYYRAVGLRIEERTGCMSSPMMKMSHEGFGRVFLTTGKLVVFAKSLRDVHRFGFETFEVLAVEGEKLVDQAVATIEEFPEVAKA